jgi:chemotaxis protein methyltransferase CheR
MSNKISSPLCTESSFFSAHNLGSMSGSDFEKLAQMVKNKYGLNLEGKKSLVENRLYYYVIDRGFTSFSEFMSAVYESCNGMEMANIINRLTTNYTYFMREQEHYRHFVKCFLPEMERTIKNDELCIWSAGCSFGNEAYNFAICSEEYFKDKNNGWDKRILATDISQNALIAAKSGMYAEAAVRNLPDEWIKKYFTEKNGFFTVTEQIRSQLVFKYHNLMEPISFKKKFDLIVCRNVMIYFDKKTKSELIKRFYDATNTGGYLYIGHAETLPDDCPYTRVCAAIYKKV